jgi:hypothetical protein
MMAAGQPGGQALPQSRLEQSLPRLFISLAAVCTVLAGCASASDVTAAGKPDTYVVSASAAGGSLAWARAHKRALTEASDYCASRGMQTSFASERMAGFEAFQQHDTEIQFECHPKFSAPVLSTTASAESPAPADPAPDRSPPR